MRIRFILFLVLAFTALGQAQEIKIEKTLGGYKFTQTSEKLNLSEIQEILQKNEEAFSLTKQGRSNHSIANILGLAGGALIGVPIGTAIGGGDANWVMAGVGAGLVAIAIPFNSQANKFTRRAIEEFNASLPYSEDQGKKFRPKWERPISFGLRAGMNISELDYNHPKLEVDGTFGFFAGAFADLKLFRTLHIQPEALYSREGAKDQVLSYLNVPILLKWYYTPDMHLSAGPQMGFLLDAGDREEDFKSQNLSAVVGVGYESPQGVLFDVRFIVGTKSILQDGFSIPSGEGYTITGMGAWPRNIQFSLGYKF